MFPLLSEGCHRKDMQPRALLLSRLIAVALLSCSLVMASAVFGEFGQANAGAGSQAKVVSPGGYEALAAKAENTGKARVIIGLGDTSMPAPFRSHGETEAGRAAISRMQDSVISELAAGGARPLGAHKYRYVPYMAMTVDAGTLRALAKSSRVVSIEEDIPEPALGTESWNMVRIGADALHASAVTGRGTAIAVLDTGVDKNHPYLSGAVVSEACYSSNDSDEGIYSLCPLGITESVAADSAMPYASGACPQDRCDHGTHVAGIAAGRSGTAGNPAPGAAPEADIIAVQVFSRLPSAYCSGTGPCVGSFPSDQIKGLERVLDLKDTYAIASVNMSLGAGKYSSAAKCDGANKSRKAIIDTLRDAGIATVVATGNEGYCGYMGAPGCISSAISVGATDGDDGVADYSNGASFMSLLAPGSSVTSSVPGGGYAQWDGTSMAAPHVAGAWALMKEKYPSVGVDDILNAFKATGAAVADSGKCAETTGKRINVNDAYNKGILVVTMAGTKKGTVSATDLHCAQGADTCLGVYTAGTSVTVTASPSANSFLDSWTGCEAAAGPVCNVSADAIVSIVAVFNPPPRISVSPAAVNFGSIMITGPFTPKTVTVRNTGTSGLSVDSVTIVGSEFAITDNQCDPSVPLRKRESCLITIEPAPVTATSFGVKSARLVIASNDPNKPTLTLNLSANVIPPKLSAPQVLNFSSVSVGTSFIKTITIKNNGLSDLVIGTVASTAGQFGIGTSDTCSGRAIAKGGSCSIDVTFTPGVPKTVYTGSVIVPSNDPGRPAASVFLKGSGR